MELTGSREYRQTARARSTAETGRRILDAAVALFWEHPTAQIPLEDVAARAGVTVQTVLRRFGSKNELFAAAAAHEARRVTVQRGVAPEGDVAGAVAVLVDHYEELGDGVLRLLAEGHTNPELREVLDQGRTVHRDWCRRVFARALADAAAADHDRLLAQLVAVCDVHTWALLRRRSGLSRAQTERALVELLAPLVQNDGKARP